jgi:hypothetical protein
MPLTATSFRLFQLRVAKRGRMRAVLETNFEGFVGLLLIIRFKDATCPAMPSLNSEINEKKE